MKMNEEYQFWMEVMKISVLILVGLLIYLNSCTNLNQRVGLENDNPVEEIAEQVIENYTGWDVDLTPEDPE